jgi:hypothetical protein
VRFYCTYFDSGYLTRGLALLESLRATSEPFRLFVLCFDVPCEELLAALAAPEISLIPIAHLEAWDPAFAATKSGRKRHEYFYTCSPVLPLYVFAHHPEIDQIVYLDADLYFFSSPAPIFDEIGDASIAVIGHRFGPELDHLNIYGRYNVGFLAFRRTEPGLACLNWWRERCIEWCKAELDGDRYADQKYLDRWQEMFPRDWIEVFHPGANVAPWNVAHCALGVRDGRVFAGDVPLVFYHFHGVKKLAPAVFDPQLARYQTAPSASMRTLLYAPYLAALERAEAVVRSLPGAPRADVRRSIGTELARFARGFNRGTLAELKSIPGRVYHRQLIYFVAGRSF